MFSVFFFNPLSRLLHLESRMKNVRKLYGGNLLELIFVHQLQFFWCVFKSFQKKQKHPFRFHYHPCPQAKRFLKKAFIRCGRPV